MAQGASPSGKSATLERGDAAIHNVSAWILRVGVVSSVAIMLLGLALSFARTCPTVAQMTARRYTDDFGQVLRGAFAGDGVALIELGILLLVLTPIVRVAGSMVIFAAEERDWFYSLVTFLVLVLTLLSLLILK